MTPVHPATQLPWTQAARRPMISGKTPAMIPISPGAEPAMVQDRVSKDTITIGGRVLPVHLTPGQPLLDMTPDR